jgi:hypothetical protein
VPPVGVEVVLEEHGAAITPVRAHHPRALVSAAARGRASESGVVQDGVVVPEPADLDASPRVDLDVMGLEEAVVELRFGDLQGEAALVHRRDEQRVRAVFLARSPRGRVFAQDPVLPDPDDPGRD